MWKVIFNGPTYQQVDLFQNDQVEKKEMNEMNFAELRNLYELLQYLQKTDDLEDLGTSERKILKWVLKECDIYEALDGIQIT